MVIIKTNGDIVIYKDNAVTGYVVTDNDNTGFNNI